MAQSYVKDPGRVRDLAAGIRSGALSPISLVQKCLDRIEEVDVDKDERPVFAPKILSAQVLSSPFEDIAPRASATRAAQEKERAAAAAAAAAAAEKAAKGPKATRYAP